jgi:Tfp pilus assembly ATPase PilU
METHNLSEGFENLAMSDRGLVFVVGHKKVYLAESRNEVVS